MMTDQPVRTAISPRFHLIAIALITVIWVICFWRILTPIADDRAIFAEGDFTVQFYASSRYHVDRLLDGEIALWNPYNYGGQPFAANLQWGTWYPPRWIAAFVLGGNGWSVEDLQLEVAVHYWLAAAMTYAFLAVLLKRGFPALVGAVMFGFGGYITAYPMLQVAVLESAVWLPLMLLGMLLSMERPGWSVAGLMMASAGLGLSALSGHPQTILHAMYLMIPYTLFQGWCSRVLWYGIIWRLVAFGVIGAGIGAVQILPAYEFTTLSVRADQYTYADIATGFAFDELRHIIWPNTDGTWSPLYVSILGLLLAVGAALLRRGLFWVGVVILALLLSLGNNTPVYDFFYDYVPGAAVFRGQERFAYLVSFGLSVLAAMQVVWLQGKFPQRWTWAILPIIALDLLLVFSTSSNLVDDTPDNRPIMPVEVERMQVEDPAQVTWRVDGAGGIQSYGVYWSIPDMYGTGPLFLASMADLRTIPVHRRWDALAVRYVTTTDAFPPEADGELIATSINMDGVEYRLYELNDPHPLVNLVYENVLAPDNLAFARQFMADPIVDFAQYGVTIKPVPVELPGERPDSSAVAYEFTSPEQLEITASTGANALMTVSIPMYPGWKATVNGDPVEIMNVYSGLMGIPLEAGENQEIIVAFEPDIVRDSAALSVGTAIAGLMITLISIGLHQRRNTD